MDKGATAHGLDDTGRRTFESKRRITQNLEEIKDRLAIHLDTVVDYLVQQNVVTWQMKQNIDSEKLARKKVDGLLTIIMDSGEKAHNEFLKALQKIELPDLVEKIKKTHIFGKDLNAEAEHTYMSTGPESAVVATVTMMKDFSTRLMQLEQTVQQQGKHHKELEEENERKQTKHDKLQAENQQLKEKVRKLENNLLDFKKRTNRELQVKDQSFRQLTEMNEKLKRDVDRCHEMLNKAHDENTVLEITCKELRQRLAESEHERAKTEVLLLKEIAKNKPRNLNVKDNSEKNKLPPIFSPRKK